LLLEKVVLTCAPTHYGLVAQHFTRCIRDNLMF